MIEESWENSLQIKVSITEVGGSVEDWDELTCRALIGGVESSCTGYSKVCIVVVSTCIIVTSKELDSGPTKTLVRGG